MKITSIRTDSIVRVLVALFVAPSLPFLLFTLPATIYYDSSAYRGSESFIELVMLAGSFLAFPVTWIVFFPLYSLFRRNNVTSIFAFVVTGAMLGLLISAFFPPAVLVAAPFGAFVGAGVWCSLNLFKAKGLNSPGSTAD